MGLPGISRHGKGPLTSVTKRKRGDNVDTHDSFSKLNVHRTKRRSGKLTAFFHLPMDIWFEVISHLLPRDLLHLSRVSRHFRSTFAARNSHHLWVAARRNLVGFPDCPSDMSEPAYAHLVFDKLCDACGTHSSRTPEYSHRKRLCSACHTANFQRGYEVIQEIQERRRAEVPAIVYKLIPRIAAYAWYEDDTCQNESWTAYLKTDLEVVANRLLDLAHSETDQAVYVEKQKADACARMKHGRALFKWEQEAKVEKIRERTRQTEARANSIKNKLREEGWDDKYFPTTDPEWCRWVVQPRPLNNRAWTAMHPKLTAVLAKTKEAIDHQEELARIAELQRLVQIIYAKIANAPARVDVYGEAMPSFSQFCQLASVRRLCPESSRLCLASPSETMTHIAEDMRAWNHSTKMLLCCHLRVQLGLQTENSSDSQEHDDALYRATSLFSVACTEVPLAWPEVGPHVDHLVQRQYPVSQLARAILYYLGVSTELASQDLHTNGAFTCMCRRDQFHNGATSSFAVLVAHYERYHVDHNAFKQDGTFLFRDFASVQPSAGLPRRFPLSIAEITQRALRLHELLLDEEATLARLLQHVSAPADPEVVDHINRLRKAVADKKIVYRKLDAYITHVQYRRHLSSHASSDALALTSAQNASNTPALASHMSAETQVQDSSEAFIQDPALTGLE